MEAINEVQNLSANVYLHFLKDGKILAFHKFNMLDYVYSQAFDSRGQFCGKLQALNIKVLEILWWPPHIFHNTLPSTLIILFSPQPAPIRVKVVDVFLEFSKQFYGLEVKKKLTNGCHRMSLEIQIKSIL